ncbi:MAG: hypothetical protein AB7Q29_19715 [Vicinamibacterales bacterium]
MPVRRTSGHHVQEREPALEVFQWGDGTWSFFTGDPVYPTTDAARRAWRRGTTRRAVWSITSCGSLPGAALAYDGLTADAEQFVRYGWPGHVVKTPEQLPHALDLVRGDRAAVDRFRTAEPTAARAIADYLDHWLAYLDIVEQAMRVSVEPPLGACDAWNMLGRSGTYADAVARVLTERGSLDGQTEVSKS